MLALAALLSSVIILVDRESLLQASVMLRWQEVRISALVGVHLGFKTGLKASRHPEDVRSIDFWSLLALPAVCFAWQDKFDQFKN